tara:strand:- start:564 stop:875 length:312 start_codon:yes stop_codon:yes gene_type:complete
MNIVGLNGFWIFLAIFHFLIGVFGIYRMRIRETLENPDSQFIAMPESITPLGMELNPQTEPIAAPSREFKELAKSLESKLKERNIIIDIEKEVAQAKTKKENN